MSITVYDSLQPGLWLFGRRGPAPHDDSMVQGRWIMASYSANLGGPLNVAGWGHIDLDGAGAGTFEETINQEGATMGPVNPMLAYEVFDDGRIRERRRVTEIAVIVRRDLAQDAAHDLA